jgi:hypothetical protein
MRLYNPFESALTLSKNLPMRFRACGLLVVLLCTLALTAQAEERRFALVIGNGAYVVGGPLKNPVNDARSIEQSLKQVGFRVLRLENSTKLQMERAIRRLSSELTPDTVSVVYYAGHGLQVNGHNTLSRSTFHSSVPRLMGRAFSLSCANRTGARPEVPSALSTLDRRGVGDAGRQFSPPSLVLRRLLSAQPRHWCATRPRSVQANVPDLRYVAIASPSIALHSRLPYSG